MKTKNTFGIHFVIRTPATEKTTMSMIYARITVNGQRTEISLKLKVSSTLWDTVRGQAKGKSQEINKINEHIERVRSLITDSYHQLIHQKKVVTVGSVKDLFLGIDDSEMSILKLIEYHDKVSVGKLSQGTLKNYSSTTKYILKYLMIITIEGTFSYQSLIISSYLILKVFFVIVNLFTNTSLLITMV